MTNCSEIRARLSELVDAGLDEETRTRVETHVGACADCRRLADDLRAVRDAARGLGPMAPPDHLWLEVAGQIQLDRGARQARPSHDARRVTTATGQWIGLAAALVLVTAGVWMVSGTPGTSPGQPVSSAITAADLVVAELETAAEHYERAIATLDAMEAAGELPGNAVIAGTLRENLDVVDRAIADSRAALQADPGSAAARTSLFDALRQKVDLLQATVLLMNEVRQSESDPSRAPGASGPSSS